jgi:hypothetical protein
MTAPSLRSCRCGSADICHTIHGRAMLHYLTCEKCESSVCGPVYSTAYAMWNAAMTPEPAFCDKHKLIISWYGPTVCPICEQEGTK